MLVQERYDAIVSLLEQNGGIIKMTEIVKAFGVSNETVRRDLDALQEKGIVKRIYGGAMLAGRADSYAQGSVRERAPLIPELEEDYLARKADKEKDAIAEEAAKLVRNGEVLFMGCGTTVYYIAKKLKNHKNLTILTNSLWVANELKDTSFDIYILGGKLDHNENFMLGDMTLNAVRSVFADKLFIGAAGVTLEYGVSDYDSSDLSLRHELIKHAKEIILVAQSEKFGRNCFSIGFTLDDVDTVITDDKLPSRYITGLQEKDVNLILAGKEK